MAEIQCQPWIPDRDSRVKMWVFVRCLGGDNGDKPELRNDYGLATSFDGPEVEITTEGAMARRQRIQKESTWPCNAASSPATCKERGIQPSLARFFQPDVRAGIGWCVAN
jgi:hypothetical protein